MRDEEKTKEQIISELEDLRRRLAEARGAETECRRAEQRLASSNAVLLATIESLPFDFWAIGVDGRYTMQNAASKQRWGECVGKRPEDVAPDATLLSLWQDNNRRAFAGETVEEEAAAGVQGEERDFFNVVAPIREKKRICGILGVNLDITQRRRAERALRESEERFRAVFEEGPIGLTLVGPDGRLLRVNRRFCEMLGYAENEILALGLERLTHPDDWARDFPFISRLWLGDLQVYRAEKRYLRKDGQTVWSELTVSLLHDAAGRPVNNVGMIEDITERKRAEENLRNSERALRTLMDASPETILLLDAEGTVLFANQTAARRLGRSAAEVVGCTVYDLLPPERTALRSKHFHEVVRTGKPVRYDDERLGRHYEGVVHPVLDEQGKVAALAVFSIDRTERKLAEERLQRAHDELERRVAERTSELSQANQQLRSEIAERRQAEEAFRREHQILKHMLQASDHERQVIAYEIHDGLAQHLAGAIMQFDVHRHLKQTKPDEAEKACDAGMTMLRQGYSEARRLIAGVRPPILDEEGIVAAIAHLANEHRRKNGPAVEYLSDVEFQRLPPILENAVYRIAQEALANACAHSRSQKVRVQLVQCGPRLRIEIQDWGVGFQPDDVGESRFGLAGIRERARLLGGEASVESKLGEGTRVVVELPIALGEKSDGNGP